MEDIRRMEDETQKELEEVINSPNAKLSSHCTLGLLFLAAFVYRCSKICGTPTWNKDFSRMTMNILM